MNEKTTHGVRVGALRQLTDTQVADLIPHEQQGWTREQYCQWTARAIERAHGIGGVLGVKAPSQYELVKAALDGQAIEVLARDGRESAERWHRYPDARAAVLDMVNLPNRTYRIAGAPGAKTTPQEDDHAQP